MRRSGAAVVAALLAALALIAFFAIAVQELHYANAHPHHHGPVKAIGLAAVAGMLVCAAVGTLALELGAGRALRELMGASRRRRGGSR